MLFSLCFLYVYMYIPLIHCLIYVAHNFMKLKFTKISLPPGFLVLAVKMKAAAPGSVLQMSPNSPYL